MGKKANGIKKVTFESISKFGMISREAMEKILPSEVLDKSVVFKGFYDITRNLESLTEEEQSAEGTRYFLKKGGGQVIDLATTPITGLPITLWSAIIADGCSVASWTLKTASVGVEDDLIIKKALTRSAEGIDQIGIFTKDVNAFFDAPSKGGGKRLKDSASAILEFAAENSASLGEEALKDAHGLYELSLQVMEQGSDTEFQRALVEKTTSVILDFSRETGSIAEEVSTFIFSPSKENFLSLTVRLDKSFKNFLSATLGMSNSLIQNISKPLLKGGKEGKALVSIIKKLPREGLNKIDEIGKSYKK
jgi:hypothetical protein